MTYIQTKYIHTLTYIYTYTCIHTKYMRLIYIQGVRRRSSLYRLRLISTTVTLMLCIYTDVGALSLYRLRLTSKQ
jgi:hypothetical protein